MMSFVRLLFHVLALPLRSRAGILQSSICCGQRVTVTFQSLHSREGQERRDLAKYVRGQVWLVVSAMHCRSYDPGSLAAERPHWQLSMPSNSICPEWNRS
jgi:hypothetical protein